MAQGTLEGRKRVDVFGSTANRQMQDTKVALNGQFQGRLS